MNLVLMAQLAVAGALVGFLIGPESLDQFIGMFPNNTMYANVIVGAALGAGLGLLGSVFEKADEG